MLDLLQDDILTRVTRYNLIRSGRMLYIDIHETLKGNLAGPFVAVPNLVSIVASMDYQGTGNSEREALEDCLKKIKDASFEEIFPKKGEAPAQG